MSWAVERLRLTPSAFHALDLPDPVQRTAWVCEATRPALVLGSTQPSDLVDREACARAGVEVVRRHSGGGAVLVVPDDLVWVDLLLPRQDPLWVDDVSEAAQWVGEAWAAALADHGETTVVHRGRLQAGRWGGAVCFAGLGPGEVTRDGAKVVGVAQRRTRAGARFQCAALQRWDPSGLVALLHLDPAAEPELATVAAGTATAPEALVASLLRHLP